MKKLLLSLLLVSTSVGFSAAQDHPGEGWKLEWQDEFDGRKINEDNWEKIPRGRADWMNYMAPYKELFSVKNGILTLRGIENTRYKKDTAQYLTGGVYTKGKKGFNNGRIEIYAKLDNGRGFWPAIWMLPVTRGRWPDGGEIDIMEHLNFDSIIYQTIHTPYTLKHKQTENPRNSGASPFRYGDWNLYALEMTPDSLRFFINDVNTFNYPRVETDIEQQYPFSDGDFYLLIDAQLGGSWVGKVDPDDLPVEMQIDWVRFYVREE
ncbi:MAG: glycoside hydrolase family 16 protein [Rikenellaceae bacterium]